MSPYGRNLATKVAMVFNRGIIMKIIKLYRKPNNPEFYILVRQVDDEILLNYPLDVPDRKRSARWLNVNNIYIEWIKEIL